MKLSVLAIVSGLSIATSAFSLSALLNPNPGSALESPSHQLKLNPQDGAMNPGPVQPPEPHGQDNNDKNDHNQDDALTISDVLPKSRKINIFASLTRDITTVASRLESTRPIDNTTLLAPLNSAMQALPRKPWEDKPGDNTGVSAARNEDKAAQNLERFVLEHVVPTSPWKAGQENKIKTLGGQEIWWEERDGSKVIQPGSVVVDGVVGKVGNGEIWALKGVVNYV